MIIYFSVSQQRGNSVYMFSSFDRVRHSENS